MIDNKILKAYINQVGISESDDLMLSTNKNETNEELEEKMNCVLNLIKSSSISKLYIHPNFDFGWLNGPSGYVAAINKDMAFNYEMFTHSLFRAITITEIVWNQNTNDCIVNSSKHAEIRKNLRKAMPLQTDNIPGALDNDTSGWSAALGLYDSRIGFYSYLDNSTKNVESRTRMYIIVDSGLHDETVQSIHNADYRTTIQNIRLMKSFDALDDSFTDYKYNGTESDKNIITTIETEFREDSRKANALKIALENNRRLTVMFASITNQTLKNKIESYPEEDYQYFRPLEGVQNVNTEEEKQLFMKALNWWPPGAIITPATQICKYKHDSSISDEAKKDLPPPELEGYKLGSAYMSLQKASERNNKKEGFIALVNQFKVRFHEKPISYLPDAESEYNTFRMDDSHFYYYSNTSPTKQTDNEKSAVIKQLLPMKGYEFYNCALFADSETENNGDNSNIKYWSNDFGSGYPTIPKLDSCAWKQDELGSAYKFSSLFNDGINPGKKIPEQLEVTYQNTDPQNKQLASKHLSGNTNINKKAVFVPELVYLSQYSRTLSNI